MTHLSTDPIKESSMKRHHKFSVAFVLTSVSGTAIGFALWSTNGIGTSTAKALSAQAITVNASSATADLYPGFTHGAVNFTITNPNPYPITISSVTPGTITSSNQAACAASNITGAAVSGLALVVPANSTGSAEAVSNVLSMASNAPDGCQGVSFTVALTVAGSQS